MRQDQDVDKKIAGYLGLAQKAGKIAAGDRMAMEAMKKDGVFLLMIAEDIAEAPRKELLQAATMRGVTVFHWQDKATLGLVTGKSPRGALAVLDKGFAEAIKKIYGGSMQLSFKG